MEKFLSEYWSWILTAMGLALWMKGPRPTVEEKRAFPQSTVVARTPSCSLSSCCA